MRRGQHRGFPPSRGFWGTKENIIFVVLCVRDWCGMGCGVSFLVMDIFVEIYMLNVAGVNLNHNSWEAVKGATINNVISL